MFFGDEFNQRKINMGNITMKSKKIYQGNERRRPKRKTIKKKIDDYLLIIGKYMEQNFSGGSLIKIKI